MTKNKNRLCLAVYSRPEVPGTYNYALMESPQNISSFQGSPVRKWHVRNTQQSYPGAPTRTWTFESYPSVNIQQEPNLLGIVVVSKVQRFSHELEQMAREVHVYQPGDPNVYAAQNFNTITWTESAFRALRQQGMVEGGPEWFDIDSKARQFVYEEESKRTERWNNGGFGAQGQAGGGMVPVLDLVDGGQKQRWVSKDDGIWCGFGISNKITS